MTTPPPTFPPVELPSKYGKAIVAIAMAVLAVVVTALGDDVVTLMEGLSMLVALCVAVGVYLVPNLDSGPAKYLKAIVAVVGTAAQAAIPLLVEGHLTSSGVVLIVLAALNALAVGVVPNVAARNPYWDPV